MSSVRYTCIPLLIVAGTADILISVLHTIEYDVLPPGPYMGNYIGVFLLHCLVVDSHAKDYRTLDMGLTEVLSRPFHLVSYDRGL